MAFLGLNLDAKNGAAQSDDERHLRAVVALMRELGVKEYEDRDGQKLIIDLQHRPAGAPVKK